MKQYPKMAITVSALFVPIWSPILAYKIAFAGKVFRLALLVALFLSGNAHAREGQTPLLLNGQPYFPVGVAGAPLDLLGATPEGEIDFGRMFTELKDAGMNTFTPLFLTSEAYNTFHDAIYEFLPSECHRRETSTKSGIGALRDSGLSVILPAWTEVEEPLDIMLDRPFDEGKAAQSLKGYNDCYTDIPILGYQTYDDAPIYEGVGIPLIKMEQFNRLAKATSPALNPHVFAVYPTAQEVDAMTGGTAQALVELLKKNLPLYSTADAADNIGVYSYPIPDRSPAAVGAAVDSVWSFRSSPQRPLVGLQAFGWRDLTALSQERRPTAHETYFMACQAIIHGAGGIVWWGANLIESSSELWKAMKRTSQVLKALSPWLVQPDSDISVKAPGVETLLKAPVGGYALLLVVNPSSVPVRTQIMLGAPKPYTIIENLGWGDPPFVTQGSFTCQIEGYGVRLFSVRFSDSSAYRVF